ncbi:hypothetical protein TNCV_4386251 [Trichonephila clavipes]|nr:hypothetical protein TNCV_4386251 [Trichonephila clavipes]
MPLGLGSNSGEDMVCKCLAPSWYGVAINNRRATNPLVRLVEGWEAPDHPYVSFIKMRVETSQIVPSPVRCSKLRLTTGVT